LEAISGRKPMLISAVSGEGVTPLLRAALVQVRAARAEAARDGVEPEAWHP
jgi:GTP-binding protein